MSKAMKVAAKTIVGLGAAYLALGEIVYEGVVNIGFNSFIRSSGAFDNKEEAEFYENCELSKQADEWFDKQAAGDTVLWSPGIHRSVYAKVYFTEEKSNKWAIVLHGYSSNPKGMAHWAIRYLEKGYNVIMPHMIAHGSDKGHYTSMGYYEKFVICDWIDYILSLNKDAKIVIHGCSMGAATTLLVTGEKIPGNVVAAVSDCAFTSCWDEYSCQVGPMFHLPAFPIISAANIVSKIRGNFDFKETSPLKATANSKTPTLFIHGEGDTFVPYRMMKPLYEACGAHDKKMVSVPEAFHAVSAFYDNDLYWNSVFDFVSKYTD